MTSLATQTRALAERDAERRRVPRIPFKATSVITESGSSQIVVAQTSELSEFGCFVQTAKPYPQGTRVHIELADGGDVFTASAAVAYVTSQGMGIVFSTVETGKADVLAKWLSRTPRRSDRRSFGASAQVRDLGSRHEQVLLTRDLSAGGCFVKAAVPLPQGSRIRVRIEHAGAKFTAIARVTDNVSAEGMGVEFIEMELEDRAILQKWLAGETQGKDNSTRLLVISLLVLVAAAMAAAIVFMLS